MNAAVVCRVFQISTTSQSVHHDRDKFLNWLSENANTCSQMTLIRSVNKRRARTERERDMLELSEKTYFYFRTYF